MNDEKYLDLAPQGKSKPDAKEQLMSAISQLQPSYFYANYKDYVDISNFDLLSIKFLFDQADDEYLDVAEIILILLKIKNEAMIANKSKYGSRFVYSPNLLGLLEYISK